MLASWFWPPPWLILAFLPPATPWVALCTAIPLSPPLLDDTTVCPPLPEVDIVFFFPLPDTEIVFFFPLPDTEIVFFPPFPDTDMEEDCLPPPLEDMEMDEELLPPPPPKQICKQCLTMFGMEIIVLG